MTKNSIEPKLNRLLGALPEVYLKRWLPHLELIELPLGQVLYASGGIEKYVYFPTSGIVSLLYVMKNGDVAEIAGVGNEGIVGFSLFLGGNSTPSSAVVQNAGWCYRMPTQILKEDFERIVLVRNLLLRYTQALITHMAQTTVCNRHHSLDEQLCRWLLLGLNRLPGKELDMTQALIANTLGIPLQAVTDCALKMQDAGLIRYSHGRVKVLDPKGLEARACECYAVVKDEYDRLLPRSTVV